MQNHSGIPNKLTPHCKYKNLALFHSLGLYNATASNKCSSPPAKKSVQGNNTLSYKVLSRVNSSQHLWLCGIYDEFFPLVPWAFPRWYYQFRWVTYTTGDRARARFSLHPVENRNLQTVATPVLAWWIVAAAHAAAVQHDVWSEHPIAANFL